MSSIPSNLSRVPNSLAAGVFLSNITRTSIDIARLQEQLATGRAINKPSDDSVRATSISILDDRLERAEQRIRNIAAGRSALNLLDVALAEANDLILEAKDIASSQIGAASDSQTRNNQAVVVDALIDQLFRLANRETNGLHLFGGSTPGTQPLQNIFGGYRYVGRGAGLINDMDLGTSVPITIGGNNAIGEVSARQRSRLDLQPGLTSNTRLADLNGGRGLGITLGTIALSFEGQDRIEVDLTGAENVGNVLSKIESAIRQYEEQSGQTILQPGFGAVTLEGGAIRINVAPGADPPPAPQPTLEFFESGQGSTAEDLGLTAAPFANDAPTGADLRPRLTDVTPLDALDPDSGLTLPLGSIRIRFERGEQSIVRQIDLSSAQTIGDVRNLIETNAPGVRVQINAQGTGLDVYNEISGPRMIIEEVAGGPETAAQLGIRTLSADTPGADFNDGRGIGIISGSINPVTGLPDPDRDVDFVITLGNGDSFTVDLRPEDLATTATILARINQQAQAAIDAGLIPPGSFEAGLTDDRNGIAFRDPLNLGPPQFQPKNNSTAARDLGLLNGSYDAASATFIAQDRAGVRVDNLFTTLMDLRDSLRGDDSVGITIAGEQLEGAVDRVAQTRALVGTYANRVDAAERRLENVIVLDEMVRSQLRDVDYAEASTRFALLQTQLQAGLASASRAQSITLLDFLG